MSTPAQTLTVRVPFTIRKRGGRKLAIAADGNTLAPPRPRIDSTLVKALARAHRWNRLLETAATAPQRSWQRQRRSTRRMSAAFCGSRCWHQTS